MKKLHLLLPVLCICLLLSGCQLFLPFLYWNLISGEQTAVQEPLPIGSDVDPNLDAEDIYYRAKFAASGKVFQYRQQLLFEYTAEEDDLQYSYQLQENRQITLSDTTCAVNLITEIFPPEYPDETSVYHEYYRDEDGVLVYYYAEPSLDICSREVITLENYTPYAIILDFTVYGYPYTSAGLTLEPQTRILNEREVYVLTYPQSSLYAFGYSGSESTDRKLEKLTIPTTWYVDAETFLPVKQEYTLTQIDDLLWQAIDARYVVGELDAGESFTGFSFSCEYESFEPVEVPPIPEDILQKAWQNAGASAN